MPIYEYQCKSCGHELEAIQRLSDDPLKQCPSCGDLALNKLISAAGFRLKGGGWYETDFKGSQDKKKNIAGETAAASKSTSGGSEATSTSDTKPAPNAAPKSEASK